VNFDEVVRWLDDRLSRAVQVTISGPSGSRGNTGAIVSGALAPGSGEFGLVDSRGGRHRDWKVGMTGHVYLLEGDMQNAEIDDSCLPEAELLIIETREIQIIVSVPT
jgi:hypothetical protein